MLASVYQLSVKINEYTPISNIFDRLKTAWLIMMKTFKDIVDETRLEIKELFPWDVEERRSENDGVLILDIREECEFSAYHIRHSMLVPRGILETACEYEYEDAVPELIEARGREIVVICR